MTTTLKVQARSLGEAIEKVESAEVSCDPDKDGTYITDSFEIDAETYDTNEEDEDGEDKDAE